MCSRVSRALYLIYLVLYVLSCLLPCVLQEKKLCFPQMPVYFFNQFSGDIIFSSLDSFAFFLFLFFCLFACFFKLIINILIHIRLCSRVSDAKMFSRPISGNKATFFGLMFQFRLFCFCFSILKFFLFISSS